MQVRLLGPFEVSDGDRVIELGASRQRTLLALLAIQAREVVPTDRLIEGLWGSAPPTTASKVLQNLVSQLRRSLGPSSIATHPSGYRLQLDDADLDFREFERLCVEGRTLLESDPLAAGRTLRDALRLWRGPALQDFAYEEFAQVPIARLEEFRLGAIEDRIDADLASGQSTELVPELEALVASNPLRERLRGALMLALYRSGRQADALAAYRDASARLREELGLEPSAQLRELEQAILNQDPALGAAPKLPRSVSLAGRRRLVLGAAALVILVIAAVAALAALTSDGSEPTAAPNTMVKIDPKTNRIVDVVAVGRNPGDIAAVGDYVFVSSEDDATLTRVDVASGEVTTTGASGADMGLAGAGDAFIWAASRSRARVTRMDARNLLPVDGVSLSTDLALAFVAVGGGSLWVSQYPDPQVTRYAIRTLQLRRRYAFGFVETPVEVAYGAGAAWVGLGGSNTLLRIDAASGRTREIPVGVNPSDPTIGFGSVWVAMAGGGDVWRIDALSDRTAAIIQVGRVPFGVAVGAGSVWVTSNCDGTVSRIDPETNTVVETIETGFFPKWLAVGGGYVWVGVAGEAFDPGACA